MKFTPIVRNRKRRAILVQVVGKEANAVHQITRDQQQAYAERIGVDYHVLRPREPVSPWSKACALHHTRYYDQTLILDVDVIPTGLTDNIFDYVPMGEWGVIDEAHMRPKELWHKHQDDLDMALDRKCIEQSYLSQVASSGVIVAPHNGEAVCYNEEREPCQNNREEKAWFTWNLLRARQKINWLHESWCVNQTDPNFNKKYPYAKFIHRNEDLRKEENLWADIHQHQCEVFIPPYEPGEYAIVTVDFSRDPFYACVRDSIVKYAEKTGAQLIEIKGTYGKQMHHCWPKYFAGIVAKDFKKTLYLDTDVYVDEMAPSIFEATPDDQWCFVDESGLVGNQSLTVAYDQCLANHELVRKGRWQIFNAGIMVIPPHGIEIYNHQKPWQLDQFWDEQTLLNNDLVGHEFHVMDTSWDTMPFTRAREPVKFFHAAGGGKFQNLSKLLDYEFNKILFYWPAKSIYAERISKHLDKQLCNGIMIGHYNFDVDDPQEEIKKYVTIVDDPGAFTADVAFYIETPYAKKLPNKAAVYILTRADFEDKEAVTNAVAWSRTNKVICLDITVMKQAEEHSITVDSRIFNYNIPIPSKDGHAYPDIDPGLFLVGMVYTPGQYYIDCVKRIKEEDGFNVITLDDYTKEVPCNYRLNNLRHSGNILSRMDAIVDISNNKANDTLMLEAVLSGTPAASQNAEFDIYTPNEGEIMATLRNLRKVTKEELLERKRKLMEAMDYDKCWENWKDLLVNTEAPHDHSLTI